MKRASTFLSELFDKPYDFTVDRSYGPLVWAAESPDLDLEFNADPLNNYKLVSDGLISDYGANPLELPELPDRTRVYDVTFGVSGNIGKTGKGGQFKIFPTVIAMFRKFVQDKNPRALYFTADKTGNDLSRSKLYDRMIKRFAKEGNFLTRTFDNGSEKLYFLWRN